MRLRLYELALRPLRRVGHWTRLELWLLRRVVHEQSRLFGWD